MIVLTFLTDVLVPLAWPIVATVIALLFKSEIKGGLTRVVKAGPGGVELTPQHNIQNSNTIEALSDSAYDKDMSEVQGLDPWMDRVERYLKQHPAENNPTALKRIAALLDREAYCTNIYSLIFGTQIKAMERMISEPKSLEQLSDLYERHVNEAGKNAITDASSWVQFLLKADLVEVFAGKYKLTTMGESFYDMLVQRNLSAKNRVW